MLNRLTTTLKTTTVLFLVLSLLQGCDVPLTYISDAGNSRKDVSLNFERGHVVGKEYELLQDLYLTLDRFSDALSLNSSLIKTFTLEKGEPVEVNPYSLVKTIPKGTKFKVLSVFVKTNYGNELCSQSIFANIIDENGGIIIQQCSDGNIAPVNVTSLFQRTSGKPNENWVFIPNPKWIKEISDSPSE